MTLTQAATITRRGIIIFALMIFLSIFSKFGLDLYRQYELSKIPPVIPTAESKFGILPNVIFPPSKISSSNFSYSIDTTTGELPQTPEFIKVYFIPQSSLTLLAPEKARELASKLGFENGPTTTATDEYSFSNENDDNLNLNVLNGNFKFKRKLASPSAEATTQFKILRPRLIEEFKRYLSSKLEIPQPLQIGEGFIEVNDEANPTQAIVSLKRSDFDGLPMVTASVNHGLVKTTMVPADTFEQRFQSVDYSYWSIDPTTYSTYPIITSLEAFDLLKNGQGFVSIIPSSSQISITSAKLAYYQSEEYSPYLQPVYLFEGPNFAAIIPAVKK